MEIIPAIDIIDGKCVRLRQGDYQSKTVYDQRPLEVALQFEAIGVRRLHLVDLDGAKAGKVVNYPVLERIASKTKLVIDFGGGIKADETIRNVFDSGAAMAAVGSIAVQDKGLFMSWLERFGPEKILLGADVREEKITISGWTEKTEIGIIEFISENIEKGVRSVFCTDVAKDGLLEGPCIDLYRKLIAEFPDLKLIASGGVASVSDLDKLKEIGCSGVILGKAIYEKRITLNDLKQYIAC